MLAPLTITIIVDSSLCHETGAAGWGMWCKRDGWGAGRQASGQIYEKPKDSAEAELLGIISAFEFLKCENILEPINRIVLQCDSCEALQILSLCANVRKAKGIIAADTDLQKVRASQFYTSKSKEIRVKFYKLTKDKDVWVRHVKGHKGKMSTRHSVNEICDTLAKAQMRAMRKQLQPVVV